MRTLTGTQYTCEFCRTTVKTAAGLQRHYQLFIRCALRANTTQKTSRETETGREEGASASENGMEPVMMELPRHRDLSPDPEDTGDAGHIDFTVLEIYLPAVFTADEQQCSDGKRPD